MNFLSAVLLIAVSSNSGNPTDYKTAYQRAMIDNKPLLVLVTAEWCPPCRVMKSTTIPDMIASKKFVGVHFATVDVDNSPKTATRLIGNRGVPQLILYERIDEEWNVKYLSGIQSVESVEAFIGLSRLRTANAKSLAVDQPATGK